MYPLIDAPVYSTDEDTVVYGYELFIDLPATGDIYYTFDNSDPRISGGTISSSSILYDRNAISLKNNVIIKARAKENNVWSSLSSKDTEVSVIYITVPAVGIVLLT